MGPENKIDFTVGTLYLDGEPIGIGTIEQLPEITVAADAPEPEAVYQADDVRRGSTNNKHNDTERQEEQEE